MGKQILLRTVSIFVFLLISESLAAPIVSPQPPSTPCNSTPYPTYCSAVVGNSSAGNVHYYGRVSVGKSISAAWRFLGLINSYLRRSKSLTVTAVRALQDCQFLAESNIDYLLSSSQLVNQTSQVLPQGDADEVQTLLSAIITNTETCIDGLQATASAWSFRNGIITPLSNDTRLYSVSLALVTEGWVPKAKRLQPRAKKLNGRRLLQVGVPSTAGGGSGVVVVSDSVVVTQDGSGNFTTISDAVNAAPDNSDGSGGYFVIHVGAGVYEEYVSVPKNKRYVMMIGEGINRTIITGNRSVDDGWTTFSSPTFAVVGKGFVAANITFQNTAGAIKHQAVAVRNGADLSAFYNCSFEGFQDTLYAHSLRQFYSHCDIYGTVDFIFGNAAAVFQDCNIYPRLPLMGQFNTITAQGRTDPNQNTGFSIQNCSVRAAEDLANSSFSVQNYLGRPWKMYSTAVVMESFLDRLINPAGWSAWSGDFGLNTSYYAEFANYGPGSNTTGRVNWPAFQLIDSTAAQNFTVSEFLIGDQWLPGTGVPYTAGLS